MKRKIAILVLCQAIFTWLQVYFISKISLIGKIGIAVAYKEYRFLRSPWKTYSLLMGVQLLVIGILMYTRHRLPARKHYLACAIVLVLALLGLWYTYNDFVHNYSHRLLKERFHLGFYLFWIGMIATSIFFFVLPKKNIVGLNQQVPPENTVL